MKKLLALFIAAIIFPITAIAQSSPGLVYGQVPTAGQWNSYFAAKQDVLPYTPVNRSGDSMTGKLVTVAPTASGSGFNLPPGSAPTTPANGDIWTTSSGLYVRVGGVTYGPLSLTFGTMATQNANAVAITGGTITGLTSEIIGAATSVQAGTNKLEVQNTSSGAQTIGLNLVNNASASATAISLDFTPNTNIPTARIAGVRTDVGGGGASDLVFSNYNGSAMIEGMRLKASGSLIIGSSVNNFIDQVGATSRPLIVQSSDTSTTVGGSANTLAIVNGSATTNNTSALMFGAITGASTGQYADAGIVAIHGARTNGQYPTGTLAFLTSTVANSAPTEKLRITSAGSLVGSNLGSISGFSLLPTTQLGASATITASQMNNLLVSATNGATYTLPVLTAALDGSVAAFANNGAAGTQFTIAAGAGNTLMTSATVGSVVLDGGDGITLVGSFANSRWYAIGMQKGNRFISASLGADVLLNNVAAFFDGPSVAQGSTGTWCATGNVTVNDTVGAIFNVILWDGTSVIASGQAASSVANEPQVVTLSGCSVNPAGNLRISVKDVTSTGGKIFFNATGQSKDSTITAYRIH